MRFKILTPNKDGKFEFTKKELLALIKEVYDEGEREGQRLAGCGASHPAPRHQYADWYHSADTKDTMSEHDAPAPNETGC